MKYRLSANGSVFQSAFRPIAKNFILAVVTMGILCVEADAQSGLSVSSAFQELHERTAANSTNFYLYRNEDDGLNHGFESGVFGTTTAVTIDTGCVDDPSDAATGCYPSSNTTALDLTRGTVLRVSFAPLSGSEYAGLNIEEPLGWGADGQPESNGYNLTGATAISFDVRSPGGISVQFGVNSCVTSFINLPASTTYTTMTIALNSLSCTPSLSSVHLLFTITTNASQAPAGGTVLLDNIQFTPFQSATLQGSQAFSLPLSTQTAGVVPQTQSPFRPDQVNRNVATIYEASLSGLTFLARGTAQDLADAQLIANSLDYALHNDNSGDPLPVSQGGNTGLHNAYSSGPLALFNNQSTGALAGNVRLAGFTCGGASPTGFCLELDGSTGGNNSFAILFLIAAYRQFGTVAYLNDAVNIATWIVQELGDTTGYEGFHAGYPDMGLPKVLETNKSTENNADIFAAFSALAAVESQLGNSAAAATWTANAQSAGNFVIAMYDATDGRFYNGTVPSGTAPGPGVCPTGPQRGNDVITTCDLLDTDTFSALALAGSAAYKNSIDWTMPLSHVISVYPQTITANELSFQGVDIIPPPPAGIAWEFTGQLIEACQYVATLDTSTTCGSLAATYFDQIGQAQTSLPFADGSGIVAATINGENSPPNNLAPLNECLSTPFQCIPERVGLAATVWAILASENLNPFWPFPGASVSPGSVTFGDQPVVTASAPQIVTLTNNGNVSLAISSIEITGANAADFGVTNMCGSNLATRADCTISVTFTPQGTGTRTAALSINDNSLGDAQTVTLTGAGTGSNFTLAVAAGSSSASVSPGGTATYMVSLTGVGAFDQTVNLSCSGSPAEANCQLSQNSLVPNNAGTNITVTVTTTAPSATPSIRRHLPSIPPFSRRYSTEALLALLLAGMIMATAKRRCFWATRGVALLLLIMTASCQACPTPHPPTNPGTPAGTYNVMVTGTSGSGASALSHSVMLTLDVN